MKNYIFLLFLTMQVHFVQCKEESYFCFQSTGEHKEPNIKPLPKNFGVSIEFTDQIKNFSADIEERFDGTKNIASLKCDHGDAHFWIFNRTSNKFTFVKSKSESETTCETKDWSPEQSKPTPMNDAPLFFPNDLIKLTKPIWSLFDMYQLFNVSTNVSVDLINHDDHDHGIEIKHYVACNKTSDDKYWIEFLVCVSSEKFPMPDKNMKNVPTRIELKIYTAKDPKNVELAFSSIYELSRYRSELDQNDEESFLPPAGVKCDGYPKTKPLPENMPKKFLVDIEYVDYNKYTIDNSKLYYDEEQKIVGFHYSHNNTDEPMTAGLPLVPGQYKVVHDFRSGLQYVLNSNTQSCIGVSSIPTTAGDVKVIDERKLGMKAVQEILFSPDAKDYVYVGQRIVDDVPLDVWSGSFSRNQTDPEKKTHVENFVFDVYFNVAPWSFDAQRGNSGFTLPVFLKVYHRNNYNDYATTAQHFHDFKIFDTKTNLLWTQLDVFPCLNVSLNDSFLMIKLNETFDNLKIAGLDLIENRLREIISNAANVSVLRVTNFYYQPDAKGVFVFFVVAEKSNREPSPTVWLESEVNAATARKKLNDSLAKKELAFDVPLLDGKILYFAVQQGFLNVTAPWFRPINTGKIIIIQERGFSRGSMAALGICMLIIGVVAGLAAAFYLWKRNRGVAYHIYE